MNGKTITLTLLSTFWLVACDSKKSSHPPAPLPGTSLTELTALRHSVWVTRIYRGSESSCSVIYDFRRDADFDFHVICLATDHQSINMESYEYAQTENAGSFDAQLVKSSCPKAAKTYRYTPTVAPANTTQLAALALQSSGEILNLQLLPSGYLSDDLRTVTSLHGKPLVRGCFSPALDQFVAQGVQP